MGALDFWARRAYRTPGLDYLRGPAPPLRCSRSFVGTFAPYRANRLERAGVWARRA